MPDEPYKVYEMPEDVKRVRDALAANAREAWPREEHGDFADSAVYTRPVTEATACETDKAGTWLVGPNFEGFGGCMIRRPDGTWWYREPIDGRDSKMKRGEVEALANCACWFTG